MKTKSTIKLFATAILATAAIGTADVVNTAHNVFASEVTVTNRDGFPAVTFETDAVFKSFEEANSYAEGRATEILDSTKGYKDYSISAEPALDGTSNYLVSGEIRAYKDYSGASVTAEEAKANIEDAARKVVNDAGKPVTPVTPEPEKPVTPVTPEPEKPSENPVKPTEDSKQENPVKPTEDSKSETSVKPSEEKSDSTKSVKETKELPNTGTVDSSSASIGLMILSVLAGFFGFKKRNI